MLLDAEFWVASAFVIFLGILGYAGGYRKVFNALDQRNDGIRRELDEARDLRQEAEVLLHDANRRRCDTDREIDAIMDAARIEARRLITEATMLADEMSRRQTALADSRILQAETQAIAEVRAAATDAAVSAAEEMLIGSVNGESASKAIWHGIDAVKVRFANGS
jgi:F-type H+-transporting ATPase subunit b